MFTCIYASHSCQSLPYVWLCAQYGILCLSVVAQCTFLIHTHTYVHTKRREGSLGTHGFLVSLSSGFPTRCGYQTSSRLLCRSTLSSPFVSSLSLCLLRKGERYRERGRERKRKESASNFKSSLAVLLWVLTPLCVEAGRQVPL